MDDKIEVGKHWFSYCLVCKSISGEVASTNLSNTKQYSRIGTAQNIVRNSISQA